MSGGYFDHAQFHVGQIADSLADVVRKNDDDTLDEWGSTVGRHYTKETIDKFKVGVALLGLAGVFAHRADWLLSDDDGEDNFHKRLDEDLSSLLRSVKDTDNVDNELLIVVVQLMLERVGSTKS